MVLVTVVSVEAVLLELESPALASDARLLVAVDVVTGGTRVRSNLVVKKPDPYPGTWGGTSKL
jgi:hypothetical protein